MPLTHRRFTADEYHRMAEAGILAEDDRVELLDGEIVEMSPIGSRHAGTVARLEHLLHHVIAARAIVWGQNPLRLDRQGEPQPDVALLRRRDDFYAHHHPGPADVFLVIEVADTSLRYDRDRKVPAYARAGLPEVWLVDLLTDRIEMYREPRAGGYADRRIAARGQSISPLRFPHVAIAVEEILG